MMQAGGVYRITLFGHRQIDNYQIIDAKLPEIIKTTIEENAFVEIYIGRNGEFDIYVASLIKRIKKMISNSNIELICILPYQYKNIEFYEEYYDSVTVSDMPRCHPKSAITNRNRRMVEMSDLVICCG